jgi:hypothetical protein
VKHPYDPRRVRAPGSTPVRQAHRVGARAAGRHVAPGLVAGGLLVAAFLSTAMVAGSTAGGPATRGHSVESTIGRSAAAAQPMQIASAGFEEQASIEMSGDVLRSTAPVRRPTVLTLAAGRVAPVACRPSRGIQPVALAPAHCDRAPGRDRDPDGRPREGRAAAEPEGDAETGDEEPDRLQR